MQENLAGLEFSKSNDSEIIAQLIAHAPVSSWEDRMAYIMRRLQGAYSLSVMTKDKLIGIRDPLGVRPLCIGKLNKGWVIASESCALDHIGAEYVREVDPGEAVMIDERGLRTIYKREADQPRASCIFEHIYWFVIYCIDLFSVKRIRWVSCKCNKNEIIQLIFLFQQVV